MFNNLSEKAVILFILVAIVLCTLNGAVVGIVLSCCLTPIVFIAFAIETHLEDKHFNQLTKKA